MIAKHVPMRSLKKSDFAGLVKYITSEQGKTERLGHIAVTNCAAQTLNAVTAEVMATQQANTRAEGDKTYHLLVSFRAGEKPDVDTLRAIEERICAGLGFGEHQRVSAIHHDTDNLHIHIAINKIHPTRNTIHEPYRAYRTLADLCATMERDYGLERDNHETRKHVSENRANDMERHAGVESLVGWVKRECLTEIQAAQSWADLHRVLGENGLQIRERANGFVLEADDGTKAKASTVSRALSKPSLEARLGTFQQAEGGVRPRRRAYKPNPLKTRVDTTELHARYQSERQAMGAHRTTEMHLIRGRKNRLIEDARRSNRLRRAAIKLMGGDRLTKRLLYAQAHKALRSDMEKISRQYQQERQALQERTQRRAWADWLKAKALAGDATALAALRAREAAQGLKGDTIQGRGQSKPGYAPVTDNITKKGTIIYRVGASAVRDDGDRLQVSRGATVDGLQAALSLAVGRYGSRISVNGTAAFKEQIAQAAVAGNFSVTFDDIALEQRRQQLMAEAARAKLAEAGRGFVGKPAELTAEQAQRAGAFQEDALTEHDAAQSNTRGASAATAKPPVGRVGVKPPPQSQHRLRPLSHLDEIRIGVPGAAQIEVTKPPVGRVGVKPPPQSQHRLRPLSQLGEIHIGGADAEQIEFTPEQARRAGAFTEEALTERDAAQSTRNAFAAVAKPTVGRVGVKPPPESQHRLRPLSQLDEIRIGGADAAQIEFAPDQARLAGAFLEDALSERDAAQSRPNTPAKKEQDHEQSRRHERGREDRSRPGGPRQPGGNTSSDTGRRPGASATSGTLGTPGSAGLAKPNIGRIGRKPPPEGQHRLRTLPELGVVRIASGSEVLLPRDVPRHMEQQVSKPADALRRTVSGSGLKTEQVAAANKYVAEREQKRLNGFDIPKHARYTDYVGSLIYAGTRTVEGQALALLKRENEILVMPVDQATAQRMKRVAIGDAISVTARGSIKTTRGRSR
ncbi:TraI/MobA(P) family conjugative relaxase [Xanthomonas vasicola]|uniref:TraI/MobA(P) family conjugative relaxase n=1 Tax=Xanthomonas vasicola TaxID=56459 RepID=UPI0030B9C05B